MTTTVSADGKTKTTTVDADGDGTTDETSTTVTAIDGSTVTTTTDDNTARAVGTVPGEVVWSSALSVTYKTVAAKTVTTVSADGLTETIQADYDGNGTYEHTETWKTQVDGSKIGTIQDVNSSSAVIARGFETISADGLTTTLIEDTANNGQINHTDTSVLRADGSRVETVDQSQ